MSVSKVQNSAQVWSCLLQFANGTARFLPFSLITEDATSKVLQFAILMKSIYNQNFGFDECKCIAEHYRKVQNILNSLKLHYFCF
jgi:hypothetical protein